MSNVEKFTAILNACHNPEAVYAVLQALGKAGFFQKKREEEAT